MEGAATASPSHSAIRAASLARFLSLVLILVAALVERSLIDTTPDVSWLITLGEKLLDGERPYVDFIEVNPPASIFIYLPAVIFARLTGISPEFTVGFFLFAGVGVSLWISAKILIGAGILRRDRVWPIAAIFAAALTLLPGATFAQREHIALVSLLPMLAASAVRAEARPVPLHWAIAAGIGAGVTAMIKPYFVFPVLFAAITAAICAHSWRPIFAPENWISAALVAAYSACVVIAYPEFISDVVPIIIAVYVPEKASIVDLLTLGAIPFSAGALLAILALKRRAAFAPPFVLLLSGAAGFLVAFAVQQKGLAYHAYPMLALILSAAVIALAEKLSAGLLRSDRLVAAGSALTIASIIGATFSWFSSTVDMRALIAPINASAPHPKILNISGGGQGGMGFPLTRQLGGTWVSRNCGQWISAGAMVEQIRGADPERSAILDRYIARDRAALTEDIARNKPDIILVDRIRYDWLKWAEADWALARQLKQYHPLTAANGILVLRRAAP